MVLFYTFSLPRVHWNFKPFVVYTVHCMWQKHCYFIFGMSPASEEKIWVCAVRLATFPTLSFTMENAVSHKYEKFFSNILKCASIAPLLHCEQSWIVIYLKVALIKVVMQLFLIVYKGAYWKFNNFTLKKNLKQELNYECENYLRIIYG